MAEKKSWRDYSNYSSANADSTEEETGTTQNYTEQESPYGNWRNYATNDLTDITKRVNRWVENNNSYLSDYNKRYEGRKFTYEDAYVSDSASWLETATKRADELEAERREILAYIDENRNYLNPEWVKSVEDLFASERGKHKRVIEAAGYDNDYWLKFAPNEEQTADGYTAEQIYGQWQQYQGDLNFDVEEGQKELEKLKTERADVEANYTDPYSKFIKPYGEPMSNWLDYITTDPEEPAWKKIAKNEQNESPQAGPLTLPTQSGSPLIAPTPYSILGNDSEFSQMERDRQEYAEYGYVDPLRATREKYTTPIKDQIVPWQGENKNESIPMAQDESSPIIEQKGSKSMLLSQYDQRVTDMESRITQAKELQEYQKQYDHWDSFTKLPDFEAKSKYKDPGEVDLTDYYNILTSTYTSFPFDDIMYDYINGNEQAREIVGQNEHMLDQVLAGVDSAYLKEMTPYEVSIYNYLYATEKNAADKYLAFLTSDLNKRHRASEEARWAELAEETPVLSSITSIAMSPLKVYPAVWQVADYIDDGKIDQNAGYNRFSYIPTAIRTQIATDIAKSGNWGEVGSWTYQLGMSMGDFLMNTAVSGGNSAISLALMGSGAMADTVIAAKDRGLSDGKALTLGVVAGGAEIITEKFSLDALLKGGFEKGAVKYILTNAFTEGTEEVSSSLINLFADIIISKEKSQWQKEINDYLEKNPDASESDAFQEVLTNTALSLGLDFLGGTLMGGMMGSGGAAINYTANYVSEAETGRTIMGSETGVNNLLGLGAEVSSVSPAETQEIIKKQSNAVSKKIDAGSTSNATARKVGRLYNTVKTANNSNNALQNQADIAKSLKRDGFDSETANLLAEALVAQAYGTDLTNSQSKLLRKHKDNASVKDALHNIVLNKKSTMGQRNQKLDQLGKNIVFEAAVKEFIKQQYTEKEFTPEGSYEVSENHKMINTKNGEIIEPQGLVQMEDGSYKIATKDGDPISNSDVSYKDHNQALVYETFLNLESIYGKSSRVIADMDLDSRNELLSIYNPKTNTVGGTFISGITGAYFYGHQGIDMGTVDANSPMMSLTESQRKFAWNVGRKAGMMANAKAQSNVDTIYEEAKTVLDQSSTEKGGYHAVLDDGITPLSLNKAQKAVYRYADEIAQGVQATIHVYAGTDTAQGFYDHSTDEIWLNLNAANNSREAIMAFTLAHELVHRAKKGSPAKYQAFVDFLMKEYGKQGQMSRQ